MTYVKRREYPGTIGFRSAPKPGLTGPWRLVVHGSVRRYCSIFAFLAAFLLAGGHWAALQGIAWSGMLISYSWDAGSLRDGARMTFSGEAPCSLCERISEARSQEQQNPTFQFPERTKEIYLGGGVLALPPRQRSRVDFFTAVGLRPGDWVDELSPPIPIGTPHSLS